MNNRLMYFIFILCMIAIAGLGYRILRDHTAAPQRLKVAWDMPEADTIGIFIMKDTKTGQEWRMPRDCNYNPTQSGLLLCEAIVQPDMHGHSVVIMQQDVATGARSIASNMIFIP